jgi:serine/threonine-protein kinase
VNQTGDRMYFVEEYLDGASLAAVITGGRLTVAQAGDIVRQVALGLQHAHEKGVAHGRLSPAAILLGKSTGEASDRPHVKVSGFGLGGFAAERESPAADFAYRAPEPFADPDTATPAADVYSLGCVLFHLLAGHPPVSPVPPIRYIRPEVPAAVAALLAAMLAEGPAARPTAEEVALRLSLFSEAVTGEGIDLNIPAATYSPATSILQSQSVVMSRPPSEPSPFAGMTLGINTHERTPVAVPVTQGKGKKKPTTKTKRKKKPARLHPLTATCVLLLIALGVTFALVLMLRRATAG